MGHNASKKQKYALVQGGRLSRREECGQKKRKSYSPRLSNSHMKKIIQFHGLDTGTKLFEIELYGSEDYEKNYCMLWNF